jgi:hypothetical protein
VEKSRREVEALIGRLALQLAAHDAEADAAIAKLRADLAGRG